jgi:hypothetical protein
MKLRATAIALTLLPALAFAQVTYTPQQLRSMVDQGRPPAQGAPSTVSETADFSSCARKVHGVVASVRPNYPAQVIVDTSSMVLAKVWTNDAAMTLTCSGPDRKLVITKAPYR